MACETAGGAAIEGRCQTALQGGADTEDACNLRCIATCGGGECAVRVLGGERRDNEALIGGL